MTATQRQQEMFDTDVRAGDPERRDRFFLSLLIVCALFLFLGNLGERSLWGSEGRWAEIAREMVASSDYRTPRINGTPYRDKPTLSYLMIAAFAPLTGGEVTELTARLPSAVSAVLSLFLLYGMGARLFDGKTALLSAMVLGTSFFIVYWGRTASADVITMAGVLLTLWIFVRFEASSSRLWIYALFLSMALNSLTKGLLGFVLPLSVLIPFAWVRKRWAWFLNGQTLAAGILAAALYLVPFFLDADRGGPMDSLFLVFKENILRFVAPFDHKEPFYFYFYEIFIIFVPWALFLPGALLHHVRRRRPWDDSGWFVFLYFCALFAFFTLSGSRRGYYLLPLLPAAALLVGKALADLTRRPARGWEAWLQVFVPAGLLSLIFAGAAILLALQPSMLAPYSALALTQHAWMAALAAAGSALAIWFYVGSRSLAFVAALLVVVLALDLYYTEAVAPEMEAFRGLPRFCKVVNEMKLPRERLAVLHQWRQGNLYFYLEGIPIRRIEDPEQAKVFLADPANRLLIEARDMTEIGGTQPYEIVVEEESTLLEKDALKKFYLIRGKTQ